MECLSKIHSRLRGAFRGYRSEAVFQLSNGQVWQQRRYKYKYKYKYQPTVNIRLEHGRWQAEFDCMDEPIEVVRIQIFEEGTIISEFNGFDRNSRFEFQSGRVWEQAEYKHAYHHAHRPEALVISGISGVMLHVTGMSEHVRVRQA